MRRFNRWALALTLLNGDSTARFILADLLYEEGEDELALLAHSPRCQQRDSDLELVLRLLPSALVIELGCTFLEHVLSAQPLFPGWLPRLRSSWLLDRLARIR